MKKLLLVIVLSVFSYQAVGWGNLMLVNCRSTPLNSNQNPGFVGTYSGNGGTYTYFFPRHSYSWCPNAI